MGCKSALYAANTATQAVELGGAINFGSAVRRFGCHCGIVGGNAVIKGVGYYDIETAFDISGAAGDVKIELYKDGAMIPGAEATLSVGADYRYHATIPAMIRSTCDCEVTITAILTGVASTITNATIKVEKL